MNATWSSCRTRVELRLESVSWIQSYFEEHPRSKIIYLRGDDIQTREDLAHAIQRGFGLPIQSPSDGQETFEWITDLKQLDYDEFAVFIYRFRECMKRDSRYKLEAFLQLSKATLPLYINEVGTLDDSKYRYQGIVIHLWDEDLVNKPKEPNN